MRRKLIRPGRKIIFQPGDDLSHFAVILDHARVFVDFVQDAVQNDTEPAELNECGHTVAAGSGIFGAAGVRKWPPVLQFFIFIVERDGNLTVYRLEGC
jgi:hypothetical protein